MGQSENPLNQLLRIELGWFFLNCWFDLEFMWWWVAIRESNLINNFLNFMQKPIKLYASSNVGKCRDSTSYIEIYKESKVKNHLSLLRILVLVFIYWFISRLLKYNLFNKVILSWEFDLHQPQHILFNFFSIQNNTRFSFRLQN